MLGFIISVDFDQSRDINTTMGKNSGKLKKKGLENLQSDALPLLELKYSDPLFELACHPEKPIILSGLANGYIYCHTYDPEILKKTFEKRRKEFSSLDDKEKKVKFWTTLDVDTNTKGDDKLGIKLMWKTKRHKGSVRCIALDSDGIFVYSIGTDNVLKKAETGTGKVVMKVTLETTNDVKFTKMVKAANHPVLVLGNEVGTVLVLDSNTLQEKNRLTRVHNSDDAINDIFPFSKRSGHKYISLGQTTLGYWDSRESNESDFKISPEDTKTKKKVMLSDDQEDEILCGTFVDPEKGEIIACGMGEGILTVWKPERNDLEDQLTRIKIAKDESVDCIIPTLQDDNCVWCGSSNGNIYKVDVKRGNVVEVRTHSSLDDVSFLDLDYGYRVISGGMDMVRVWDFQDAHPDEIKEGHSEEEMSDNNNDNDSDGDIEGSSYNVSDDSDKSDSDIDSNVSDGSCIWDDLEEGDSDAEVINEAEGDSDAEIDNEAEDESDGSDDGKRIGLSKEELIAELDKELTGGSDSEDEQTKKRSKKDLQSDKDTSKKQKKQKLQKKLQNTENNSHGITKFEGL